MARWLVLIAGGPQERMTIVTIVNHWMLTLYAILVIIKGGMGYGRTDLSALRT